MKRFLITILFLFFQLEGVAQNDWGYFSNLEDLRQYVREYGDSNLTGLQLWDFSCFELLQNELNVSKIKTLKVFSSKLVDLKFLRGFKNLETLELEVKLEFFNVENLPNTLKSLKIRRVPKNINIGKLELKLRELELGGGWDCEDIALLGNGDSLKNLSLSSVDLNDLNCFSSPFRIHTLQLEDCKIKDLDKLKTLTAIGELKSLSISRTDFSRGISISAAYSSLERLSITFCKLSFIDGLERLNNIFFVNLSNNQLSNLSINLPCLKYLTIANNKISVLTIEEVAAEFALDVSNNKLRVIKGFNPIEERVRAFYYCGNPPINLPGTPYFSNLVSFSFAPEVVTLEMDKSKLELVYDCSKRSESINDSFRVDHVNIKVLGIRHFKVLDIEEFRSIPNVSPPHYL